MKIFSKFRKKKEVKQALNSDRRVWSRAKDCPDELQGLLFAGDYGWDLRPFKRVILVNPFECRNIQRRSLEEAWAGTGHLEWELLLMEWFAQAIRKARDEQEKEADISALFNKDFTSENGLTYSREQVYRHLLPSFEVISETEEELRLRFKVNERKETP